MRLSVVILPTYPWAEARDIWRRAESLGFHAAYTYDHLSWRTFVDRPWFAAAPTLTAAATATERIRLGTPVASPNFRHPVTLAKELMTLDDISGGRLTAGIGAGGWGFDAGVLGQLALTSRQRADRFDEFVELLDSLLHDPSTTRAGHFYSAVDARMIPGSVQRPRPPMVLAATGRRGMALTARYGDGWVTYGDPAAPPDAPAAHHRAAVASQLRGLREACGARGRDAASLARLLLHHPAGGEAPLSSLDAFVDWAARYGQLGITELVLHWPVPDSEFECEPAVFERIATKAPAQLGPSHQPGVSG